MDFELDVTLVESDLMDATIEILVCPWDQSFHRKMTKRSELPWWRRTPWNPRISRRITAAVRRKVGMEPFRELVEEGPLAPGEARLTGPGRLRIKGVIHAADLDHDGVASLDAIRACVHNCLNIVHALGFGSIVFPLLGAGAGRLTPEQSLSAMKDAFEEIESPARVFIVRYSPTRRY